MSDSLPPHLKSCTQCGAELPAGGTNGLCPACLMAEAMKPSGPKTRWEPPTAQELAKLLPQYEITRMLGRGGMGAVYQGTQKSLDRAVAIKILSNDLETADASFAERFKNEARAMAKLSHPGIVAVHDFGETANGLLYIVMEFIEGTDVARMIAKDKRLHTDHAMAITAHVCDALAYAHERGIIHRDIKPANIMVGYDGVVKVADFGLAKMSKSGESALTQSGMAMGTLHFMAPEALMLGTAVDQRADIYAVGVMLYQMLTGKVPQGMFELPSLQVPGLDPRYDGIIGKALREDRDLRYPSALDMRHDLDAILTQPVVKLEAGADKTPAALNTQVRPKRPGGKQPYSPQSEEYQPQRVTKFLGAGFVWLVLAVVVLGIGAYVFFGSSKNSAQDRQIVEQPSANIAPGNDGTSLTDAKVTVATPPQPVPMVAPAPTVGSTAKADVKSTVPPDAKVAATTPPQMVPMVTPSPADVKSATIKNREPFRWELAFTKETYESRRNLPELRQPSEDVSLVHSDHNLGVLRWQFADARLSQQGVKITGALLRFHTSEMPGTTSDLFVTLNDTTIGRQSGVPADTWNEMALTADKIPRTSASFDLVLQSGQFGGLVHNQKSTLPARLILIGEATDASTFNLQQLPDFSLRVANYQKARHAQLSDLIGKYRNAVTTVRTEVATGGALADVKALDDAIARATTLADEIAKNVTSPDAKPLSALPELSPTVPKRLKELRTIFERETAKIETILLTSLDQSLAAVQASLGQAANPTAAKAVEDYRKQTEAAFKTTNIFLVAPVPTQSASTASPLLLATKDKPFVNSLGMKFVPVPGTKTLMCIHETRNQDYDAYDAANPLIDKSWGMIRSEEQHAPTTRKEEHPVTSLNKDDTRRFCAWLTQKEGRHYRLPTDEEWSIAVGLGALEKWPEGATPRMLHRTEGTQFPWGGDYPPKSDEKAGNYSDASRKAFKPHMTAQYPRDYDDGYVTTAPVMSFKPNKLGLYDMGGNVSEWVADWYDATQKEGVLRGGSWTDGIPSELLSSNRLHCHPDGRGYWFGFRCVLVPGPIPKPAPGLMNNTVGNPSSVFAPMPQRP